MSQETGQSTEGEKERTTLPIEKGFPIERVNEIAEKEKRAGMHYRPIYTMHKWWARRLGCVFRSICLYTLLDDPEKVTVQEPGEDGTLGDFGGGQSKVQELLEQVDMTNPESLWELYSKDVRVDDKKILDPFTGGGTSLVEASRFGVEADGYDLNPVAWFITKKELEAGTTDIEELEAAFEQVKEDVADDILDYYKTPCPNGDHYADVMHYFWVKKLDCSSCNNSVSLFKDYRVGKGRYENKGKYNVLCPNCERIILVDDWQSESECSECDHQFIPKEGTVGYGNYTCSQCGQKYGVTDAINEQNGFSLRLYAVEYYCKHCDDKNIGKNKVKGYKSASDADRDLYETAKRDWKKSDNLRYYIPDYQFRIGWKTDAKQVDGTMPGKHGYGYGSLPQNGYGKWSDMFNDRQLLCLSMLLKRIDEVESKNHREFLLLAFSDALNFNNSLTGYQSGMNKMQHLFKSNSFDPPQQPCEANPWGTEYGMGTFRNTFNLVKRGIEYAKNPTERFVKGGETKETKEFSQPIGEGAVVNQGDARLIQAENEYDFVITDPPYYNNVIYSELSDYYYVWIRNILRNDYEFFEPEHTPRKDSIVVNPAAKKGIEEFESELKQSFSIINKALKDDGALVFTYHHSESESWGELLNALCDTGFIVTATYPVSADVGDFYGNESVEFDIIIVARQIDEQQPISWNSLRRNIVKTARATHKTLKENRDLTSGDIGVIEMGKCFQEYSKHHNEVRRAGEIMTAKDVVDAIYGIIQSGNRGEEDVYLDLLDERNPTYSDLNKHLKRSDASEELMREMRLFRTEAKKFQLLDWRDEKRQAYVQSKVQEDNGELTDLDKAHFLRYRFEQGKSTGEYLERWNLMELQELCEGLAEATSDDTYLKMLGVDTTLDEYGGGT